MLAEDEMEVFAYSIYLKKIIENPNTIKLHSKDEQYDIKIKLANHRDIDFTLIYNRNGSDFKLVKQIDIIKGIPSNIMNLKDVVFDVSQPNIRGNTFTYNES